MYVPIPIKGIHWISKKGGEERVCSLQCNASKRGWVKEKKRRKGKTKTFHEPSLPLTSPTICKYHYDRLLVSAECVEHGLPPGSSSRRHKETKAKANESAGR